MSADGAVSEDTTDVDEGADGAADEGGEPAASGAEPEARETRKERRRNEFREAQETARLAREELAAERARTDQLAREVAEMRGRQTEREAQSERDRKDPYADQIAKLEDEAQTHLEAVGNAKDPAKQREHLKQYHAKMREAAKLDFKRDQENEARANPKPQPQNGGLGAREVAIMTAIEGEFPTFVQQDKQGAEFRALSDLHLNRLMAAGKPYGLATIRAACAEAAKEMKIGGKSNGSPNRARFGASGAGDGEGGAGEGDRGDVAIGRQEEALAMAMANRGGKGLTKDQAVAEWRKRVAPGVKRRLASDE